MSSAVGTPRRLDQLWFLWEAFLQWIGVRGRYHTPLCQPSLAVDDLWGQLSTDATAWSTMPTQVQAMHRVPVRSHGSRSELAATHVLAHWDLGHTDMPLLFRVDEVLGMADGRLYRGDCVTEDCSSQSLSGDDSPPLVGPACTGSCGSRSGPPRRTCWYVPGARRPSRTPLRQPLADEVVERPRRRSSSLPRSRAHDAGGRRRRVPWPSSSGSAFSSSPRRTSASPAGRRTGGPPRSSRSTASPFSFSAPRWDRCSSPGVSADRGAVASGAAVLVVVQGVRLQNPDRQLLRATREGCLRSHEPWPRPPARAAAPHWPCPSRLERRARSRRTVPQPLLRARPQLHLCSSTGPLFETRNGCDS